MSHLAQEWQWNDKIKLAMIKQESNAELNSSECLVRYLAGSNQDLKQFKHDLIGAIRVFRFLAEKDLKSSKLEAEKIAKKRATIDKHLLTLESSYQLIDSLLDQN